MMTRTVAGATQPCPKEVYPVLLHETEGSEPLPEVGVGMGEGEGEQQRKILSILYKIGKLETKTHGYS